MIVEDEVVDLAGLVAGWRAIASKAPAIVDVVPSGIRRLSYIDLLDAAEDCGANLECAVGGSYGSRLVALGLDPARLTTLGTWLLGSLGAGYVPVLLPSVKAAVALAALQKIAPLDAVVVDRPALANAAAEAFGEEPGRPPIGVVDDKGVIAWTHSRQKYPHSKPVRLSSAAAVVFTSGTTGPAKPIVVGEQDLIYGFYLSGGRSVFRPHDECRLVAQRWAGVDAIFNVLAPLTTMTPTVNCPSLDGEDLVKAAVSFAAKEVVLVPPALARIVAARNRSALAGSAVQRFIVGSSKASAPILDEARRLIPDGDIWIDYSTTESGRAGVGRIWDGQKPSSVGLPYEKSELCIVFHGEASTSPSFGEVHLRHSFLPARRHLVEVMERELQPARHRWTPTGDLGYLDEDGDLHLVGRFGAIANRGGQKILVSAVADEVRDLDCVADCSAVVIPDALLEEDYLLAVVPLDGVPSGSVRKQVADRIEVRERPRRVVVVPVIPRDEMGKVNEAELLAAVVGETADPAGVAGQHQRDIGRVLRDALVDAAGDVDGDASMEEVLQQLLLSSLGLFRLQQVIGDALGINVELLELLEIADLEGLVAVVTERLPPSA